MSGDLPPGVIVPEVDFEVERLTMVVLYEGPRRCEYSDEDAQRLANEHVHYVIGLARDGAVLHAGTVIDADPKAPLTGIAFSRLSHDELRPLIANDPAVVAGMESFKLVTHGFRKGGLAFPQTDVLAAG